MNRSGRILGPANRLYELTRVLSKNRRANGKGELSAMTSTIIESMDETELQRNVALLGRPPVLSTEDVEAFKKLFVMLAKCLRVNDFLMLELSWQYAANTWFIRRLMGHSTIAIERWYARNRNTEFVQAQLEKAQYENRLQAKAQQFSRGPADVAEMAALEKKI